MNVLSKIKKIDVIRVAIVLLVLLMPTHRMLFDAILPWKIDNLWRDALLALGIILVLIYNKGLCMGRHGVNILLMWLVCGVYLLLSDRFSLALNLARTYLMPTLIYFIVINIKYDQGFIKRLEKIFVYTAVVLAVFGMVQAFILGEGFLIALGYEAEGGYLASPSFYISYFHGEQRVTSTFSAPNICGLYFGMVILVLYLRRKEIKRSKLMLLIMALGLVTTFSRSAILGTAVALLAVIIAQNIKRVSLGKRTFIMAFVFTVGAVLMFIAINSKLDGLITNMLKSNFMSIINKTDASAGKHLEDLFVPLKTVIQNPFGLGFGHNGPMVAEYYSDANLVESSLYLLMYDFGIIGALIFIFPYIRSAFRWVLSVYRKLTLKYDNTVAESTRQNYKIPAALSVLILVVSLLLPSLQTYEILFVYFFFLAVSEVKEKNEVYAQGIINN